MTPLAETLAAFDICLQNQAIAKINDYCGLLWSANRDVNLTRHTDFRTFVARDVIDVVQLSNWIEAGDDVLDIGSGGGVPGILLAIIRQDLKLSLCESVGKKARLLSQFVDSLDLDVAVFHDRAEKVLDDSCFDCCVARAVGPLYKIGTWLQPHWLSARRLLAIKGPRWVEERDEALERGCLQDVELRKLVEYPMESGANVQVNTAENGTNIVKSVILELRAKSAPEKT